MAVTGGLGKTLMWLILAPDWYAVMVALVVLGLGLGMTYYFKRDLDEWTFRDYGFFLVAAAYTYAKNARKYIEVKKQRRSAPGISALKIIHGDPVQLGKGKITIVFFWSPTDKASRAVLASLSALTRRHRRQDLQVLGVSNTDETIIRGYLKGSKCRIEFSVAIDLGCPQTGNGHHIEFLQEVYASQHRQPVQLPSTNASAVEASARTPAIASPDIARHRHIMNLFDKRTDVRWEATFVAPNATVVGDVELVDRTTTVWYGAVLRGDDNHISVGGYSSIGDNTTVSTVSRLHTGLPAKCTIGNWSVIEAGCSLTSCKVGNYCKIGAGSTLSEGCVVGDYSIVRPGTLLPSGTFIGEKEIWAGFPAQKVGEVDDLKAVQLEAEAIAAVARDHADEWQPYGMAWVQAEKHGKYQRKFPGVSQAASSS